ncbi:DNA topoisomerase I [Rhodothalassium salexigens]|uniref:type I DNA topoisomerase n=1 Tax=Rhodothalassium salexigens TaxID=1086 RepID=UPI0019114103|nr:type I DNA topoisomerase [Rhodothalassium salexigens]MBK5911915.1 DNA topoisomerase I [Rhodothalassium salexigens]
MKVVVVESPAKAKTINKYLGQDYRVVASYGHVRDLPSKDGSVDPEQDFAMAWEVDSDGQKRLKAIADQLSDADTLVLATDPDREGEAISWHVLEWLRHKKPKLVNNVAVRRVVFNEITKSAILDAVAHPREVDQEMVDAYLARRALDYLVGFTLSPVLWRKLPGAKSAGRVQSVALRLVCERETEIDQFVPQEYWTVTADLTSAGGDAFKARLHALEGRRLQKFDLKDETTARAAVARIEGRDLSVQAVEKKPARRHPQPPFTTSTLQQEASRKLGFSASKTMRVAQSLYEGKELDGETTGLITYMRTDGVTIAAEALHAARRQIESHYGPDYLPASPRVYKSKAKNAQEAHEAIRPTDPGRRPGLLRSALNADEIKLYELIWKRTLASQMESARVERTTVDITTADGAAVLRATGQVIQFDGFLTLYQEGRDDEGDDDDKARLPKLAQGEAVAADKITPEQHFTEPPPRYSEASLVKKLEELGIGRPSTYASILSVLQDRNYVRLEKKRFHPEDKGRLVTAFLESFFKRYVEYDFTAKLEEQLDEISAGQLDWKRVLNDFWSDFKPKTEEVLGIRNAHVIDAINDHLGPLVFKATEDNPDPRACPKCADGRLAIKAGRFGAFIGCSNYPDCRHTKPLGQVMGGGEDAAAAADRVLGQHPETGREVSVKVGRFGPYVEMPPAEDGDKPKRASIPKDRDAKALDLDMAVQLLSLPREVGPHPETGEPITANIGRYGPYVQHQRQYGRLSSTDEVFSVGINRAVALIAEAKTKRRGATAQTPLKELGNHPDDGEPVAIYDGRYGPYVKHGKVNATIPKGQDPQAVTLEQALPLLAEKAKKTPAKKTAARKTPAKKAPAKKTAAKTTAAKTTATKSTAKAGTKTAKASGTKAAGTKTSTAKAAGNGSAAKGTTKTATKSGAKTAAKAATAGKSGSPADPAES